MADGRPVGRRAVLAGAGLSAASLVSGCTADERPTAIVSPHGRQVAALEARRRGAGTGRVVTRSLTAAPGQVDLGGRVVSTWLYDGQLPGPVLEAVAGDELAVRFRNRLPEASSVHWHGIAIRNDMDGVPGLTQPMVMPETDFAYRFTVADPGSYWAHSHSGMQPDRGLYMPLVVRPKTESTAHDVEHTVVLDDWLDGAGTTPDAVLARLQGSHPVTMRGMDTMLRISASDELAAKPWTRDSYSTTSPWRPMLGNVAHRLFLVNGRLASDPVTLAARPGARVLVRLINAGADTAFRVRLAGHRLTVVAADGHDIRPVVVDELLLAMGERYDVVVTAGSGRFVLTADAEGKGGTAEAVLATSSVGALARSRPGGRLLTYADLVPASDGLRRSPVARTLRVRLDQADAGFVWTMNGRTWNERRPLDVRHGERVRLVVDNGTDMFHPMHLHGHAWAVVRDGATALHGARKDVTVVRPGSRLTVDFDADNPGRWPLHCHNAYHGQSGMMTELRYLA